VEPLRVVQWSTGNVGRQALAAVLDHPELELVGLFAFGAEKVGRDAGELCGRAPVGIAATDDVDALLALRPDCVVYTPAYGDDDTVVRFLESGINVVTTSGYITVRDGPRGPHFWDRLDDAAQRGGASLLGTGLNPGYVPLLATVLSLPLREVRSVAWEECSNVGFYDAPDMWATLGFGVTPEARRELVGETGVAPGAHHSLDGIPYLESCYAVAHALGLTVDGNEYHEEVAVATAPIETIWGGVYDTGTVAGLRLTYVATRAGEPVVTSRLTWRMGDAVTPAWDAKEGYHIEIDGDPALTIDLGILPGSASNVVDLRSAMDLGMTATACPAVHAVAAVCAAAPGILAYTDLPIHAARTKEHS
jgi:hypothetical protein